ncbi:MAG TPA: hypothetical protein VJ204_01335 [Solirubrobacterales bacterium]|nr:hypothetical protein [Solirubrobacterales bacterium]
MKLLRTAALTGIVIAAVVVLALEPASGASTDKNVASCKDNVLIDHGKAGWRSEMSSAGPVGVPKWPLRQMAAMKNGDLVAKAGVLVEGSAPVLVKVPESLRERVFLYYGRGPNHRSISFAESNGFNEVEFQPCEDRPRTIWPGGLRVKGKGSVHLMVEAVGKTAVLNLGQPKLYEPPK